MEMKIPLLDLVTPHLELEDELVAVFRDALKTATFVGGPMLEDFESDFAEFCGTRYCAGVNSGTDALRFALIAAGVRPNDVVVTVPNTFIATTEAISQAGAIPEFVDIDEHTYNIDPGKLHDYLETQCTRDTSTGRTVSRRSGRPVTSIIPVHLYGQMADMDPIMELAERYQLIVIEDACQAHGAEYFSKNRNCWLKAGSMGRAAAFSFYPGKNLGACGEAGAVTTNDANVAKRIKMIRDHGQAEKYYHEMEGFNGRLDAVQAGILRVKLPYVAEWNRERRMCAALYRELFGSANGVILPFEPEWSRAVYHIYPIRALHRRELRDHLLAANIGTGVHYPIPLHLQKAYCSLGYREGDFQVAEQVATEILSLPMYPQLGRAEQEYIVENVLKCLSLNTAEAGYALSSSEPLNIKPIPLSG